MGSFQLSKSYVSANSPHLRWSSSGIDDQRTLHAFTTDGWVEALAEARGLFGRRKLSPTGPIAVAAGPLGMLGIGAAASGQD